MEIYESMLWFFGGAFTYKLVCRLLGYYQMLVFVQAVTIQCLKLMGTLAEDVAFAKSLKYRALNESGFTEEEIKRFKEVDTRAFTNWKVTTLVKFITCYPKPYRKMLGFYDWDGAMKSLNDIYIKEARANERTRKSDNT